MVKIEDVTDDAAFVTDDEISSAYDSEEDSPSALEAYNKNSETYSERFYALKDILTPSTRSSIVNAYSTTSGLIRFGGNLIGNLGWIIVTSSLMIGLPLMLSIEGEAGLIAQEKEFNLSQSQATNAAYGVTGAAPGVVPAGF